MATNPARLALSIYNLWTASPTSGFSAPLSPAQQALLLAQCTAIATGVLLELTTNAVVTANGADPQGGVVASTGTVA